MKGHCGTLHSLPTWKVRVIARRRAQAQALGSWIDRVSCARTESVRPHLTAPWLLPPKPWRCWPLTTCCHLPATPLHLTLWLSFWSHPDCSRPWPLSLASQPWPPSPLPLTQDQSCHPHYTFSSIQPSPDLTNSGLSSNLTTPCHPTPERHDRIETGNGATLSVSFLQRYLSFSRGVASRHCKRVGFGFLESIQRILAMPPLSDLTLGKLFCKPQLSNLQNVDNNKPTSEGHNKD